jgi:hypothetical protein
MLATRRNRHAFAKPREGTDPFGLQAPSLVTSVETVLNFARRLLLLAPMCLALGCSSTPTEKGVRDPAIEESYRQKAAERNAAARGQTFEEALITIDQSLDEYTKARVGAGNERLEQQADALARFLNGAANKHFDALMKAASDPEYGRNRAVALAALGFSQRREPLDLLVSALADKESLVRSNAAFALGELTDPRTPAAALGRLIEDDAQPDLVRISASRALLRLQLNAFDTKEIAPIWSRVLSGPVQDTEPAVLVHAIRGLGMTRDRSHVALVEPAIHHPDALVRSAAAIALGRFGDPAAHKTLLLLLGPNESNPNVRLCARKALQALAGGADRVYDVEQWRKLFERGG